MQPSTTPAGDWLDSLLGAEDGQPAPAVAHTGTTLVQGGSENGPPAQSRKPLIPEGDFQLPMDELAAGDVPVSANHAGPELPAETRSGGIVPVVRRILRRRIVLMTGICGIVAVAACVARYHGTGRKAADQAIREERESAEASGVPLAGQHSSGEGEQSDATKPQEPTAQRPATDSPAVAEGSNHQPKHPASSSAGDPQSAQPAAPQPPSAIPALNPTVSGDTQPVASAAERDEIGRRVSRSLVRIHVRGVCSVASGTGNAAAQPVERTGLGFVYDEQGHIVTSAELVQPAGAKWTDGPRYAVEFAPERASGGPAPSAPIETAAELVGFDGPTDLSILKMTPPAPLPVLTSAQQVTRGERAIVGLSSKPGQPAEFRVATITGVDEIARGGQFAGLIRLDAPVDAISSGAPILNMQGQVVGVNCLIETRSDAGRGPSVFALSIQHAAPLLARLIAEGRIVRGSAGIALYNVAPEALAGLGLQPGAMVATARRPGSESEVGQVLQADDVITRVGEREIRCTGDLLLALADIKPGETARVEVTRFPRLWLRTQLGLPTTSAAEESERARSAVLWRFLGRSGKEIALSLSLAVEFK